MRRALPLLLLCAACGKKPAAPPPPHPPQLTVEGDKAGVRSFEPPPGWTLRGTELDKGLTLDLASPSVRATLKRIRRPMPPDKKAWESAPRILSSHIDLPGVQVVGMKVGDRNALRAEYQYREIGTNDMHPLDRRAIEVYVDRDASSCYEILFLFADKEEKAAVEAVDRFLAALKIVE